MSEQYTRVGVIGDRGLLAHVRKVVGPDMRVAVYHRPCHAATRLSRDAEQSIARYAKWDIGLHVVSAERGQLVPVVSGVVKAARADRRLLFLVEGDYYRKELVQLRRICNARPNVEVVISERLRCAVRAADLATRDRLRHDLGARIGVTVRYQHALDLHEARHLMSAGLCVSGASPEVREVNEDGVTIGDRRGPTLRLMPDVEVSGYQFEIDHEWGGYPLFDASAATVPNLGIDTEVLRLCAELVSEQDPHRAHRRIERSGLTTLIDAETTAALIKQWAIEAPARRRSR